MITITIPRRVFVGHEDNTFAVAVFPDGCRMVTGSVDKTLRLWDLKNGAMLKKMEGHRSWVRVAAVSGNGKCIASGDGNGELIAWNGDTGKSVTKAIQAHSFQITSLDFSPDSAMLATVSWDGMIKLWRTDTWQIRNPDINTGEPINCVRYSPSGGFLAIATGQSIQIWNQTGSECIAKFRPQDIPPLAQNLSLAWAPDGTRLFSAGNCYDPTLREWDTSTWKYVGDHWNGHTNNIDALTIDSTGTFVASASSDKHVRLWRLSDRKNIAIFQHSKSVFCSTFSTDGKYILCGGDPNITQWGVPDGAYLKDTPKKQAPNVSLSPFPVPPPKETLPMNDQGTNNTRLPHSKIFSMNATVHDACLTSNLPTAQELLTQHINADENNHSAFANRSFVYARQSDWDNALHNALQSVSIRPSLTGYISKGIALCGIMDFKEATKAFDIAFMFAAGDSNTILLLLVKAVALFNANQHDEAMSRIKELASICPNAGTLACNVVEAYLCIQLGINMSNDARHSEAADHFTSAINTGVLSYKQVIHPEYEFLIILFGWDLASLWKTANQGRCYAHLRADRLVEAHAAYKHMMNECDNATKANYLDWSTAFRKECSGRYVAGGDTALAEDAYDRAIQFYSAAIDLDPANDAIVANRCKAKLGKKSWEDALDDAQKVIELYPSSYLGYELKHAALHGARRYDEAVEAFEFMLLNLDNYHDTEMQALRQQYISPSEAQYLIRKVIDTRLEDCPPRLLNTSTGRLCDRRAQINAFEMSSEYKELLSFTIKDANLPMDRIHGVVTTFFCFIMLSHRWEGKEPHLHEIENTVVYDLHPVGSIFKLQSFCKIVRDAGYRWAWMDTCCIDQNNNVEVQRSVNSMFAWYRHSALTIIFLSDVPPSSMPGAMAGSAWNTRGWTVQEFLAPKIVLFYQSDWTLYLNDRSPNHKRSTGIMRELEGATGIDGRALTGFQPGMGRAREKLQWASLRVTTFPEDIAYCLFGIFDVHLPVIYGEKKHNALGRLLQEIIAQSGDISCLDWVGESSEFNSCLPANISSYAAPPFVPPSLSRDEMETSVSSLRDAGAMELASQLYTKLDQFAVPRFTNRRLRLPCIVFTVTQVTLMPNQEHETYAVKANYLRELLVTTEDKQIPFFARRQKMLLVRPWDRDLLELDEFVDGAGSMATSDSLTLSGSSLGDDASADLERHSQALRLIVRLRLPFRALLLAQQRGREYNRIATNHDIITQVEDIASVCSLMDVRMDAGDIVGLLE